MFPFEHVILIEKESKIAIYRQIAISIINAIRSGILKSNTHLPGSRKLAMSLGVHRKTVIAAYEELESEGWVVIIPRKYVVISENAPSFKPQKWNQNKVLAPYENNLNISFKAFNKNMIKESSVCVPDILINDGHPDVRLSPIDDLLKTYRSLTSRKYAIRNANIGTTQGTLSLREEMVDYLSETRGINILSDNLLITHGAQMSIYLASQLLLEPFTHVIVGKPNYPLANKTFEETGAKIIEIDVDDEGIDTDAIEIICKKKKISVVYVIPHHHYPTTATLSVERRMKLLELSKQYSFAIIEDDYDYDYHYTSSPYLPLASANHNGNVVYIGSFSKILDPSLRMGFMIAPKNFITQCTALRNIIDVGGDGYMQNALAALIKGGELERHLKKAKRHYNQRRDFLDKLLKEQLGDYVYYTLPTGGMAIWVKLKPAFSISQLISNTKLQIIRIDEEQNAFRFGFASLNETELKQTVEFLKMEFQKIQSINQLK